MYILTIDQSTSSTKAIIFDEKGELLHRVTKYHKQYYPKPGWVEHNPVEIFQNTLEACKKVIEESNVNPCEIMALAITNQRETSVVWEKNSGKPVYNAIVWQCQRGREICEGLKEKGLEKFIKERTGLLIDPYFSASKVKWMMENIEGLEEKAREGKVLFGTIDSWLVWNLTNGKVHATDFSNASRTMLLNIHKKVWDEDILEIFSLPSAMLPVIKDSDEIFGYTDLLGILPREVPIVGIMGDSSAALFGQGGFAEGDVKATYGTGTSIMMNIGEKPVIPESAVVCSIGWSVAGKVCYVLEGNIHSTGDAVAWLVNLGLIDAPEKTEELAHLLSDNEGIYFIPAFVGLGAPYWRNDVRGAIFGLHKAVTKAHIVRAALEAVAYQVRDLIEVLVKESGKKPEYLKVDGGMTKNRFLMQFQADILDIPVLVSNIEEISAKGVCLVALLKLGVFNDLADIKKAIEWRAVYHPQMSKEQREKNYEGWKRAISKLLLQ